MSAFKSFVVFAVGAAVGSAVTWYYVKDKYAKIAQEEIDSVKEKFTFRAQEESAEDQKKAADLAKDKPDISQYAKQLSSLGYKNYSQISEEEPEEETSTDISEPETEKEEAPKPPYVISPDAFGEAGYDQISFAYYADHILTDENDDIVEDVEGTVGFESLNHFGEYEDDSVFVRNERLKVDFEILLDRRKYSDIAKSKPHL